MLSRIGVALAVGLLLSALNVSSASAQLSTSTFVGHWWGAVDWEGAEYDAETAWDFHADGTFVNNHGGTGTWSVTATGIDFQYNNGAESRYTGNLVGSRIVIGVMTNGDISGVFVLISDNGAPDARPDAMPKGPPTAKTGRPIARLSKDRSGATKAVAEIGVTGRSERAGL